MKYEAPFGVSDPNSSYINGNPSTGTMGSIPPAASIENPQREIVNFINANALTPSAADLFQLAKSVQAGLVNYGTDQGVPNQIAITPTVPISAYALGQRFVIKLKYGNTSKVTINVNGIGGAPLIHTDLSPINPYELIANQLIEVAYDGANFQAIGGVGIGGSVLLTAPQNLYVNASTGSDTLYDGTSATIGGQSGPFQTIQKALATMKKYNLGGWTFTIHVADGTYSNPTPVDFPQPNGSGLVALVGNTTNPSAVLILNSGSGSCWRASAGGNFSVNGFSFQATAASSGDLGSALWWTSGSSLSLYACSFGAVPGYHILVGPSASCLVFGPCTITGSALAHQYGYENGTLLNATPNNPTLNIPNAVTFSNGFVIASNGGQTRPIWSGITGAGNVTGAKYIGTSNGVIDTNGRGASYLPGTIAGSLATGGQYL